MSAVLCRSICCYTVYNRYHDYYWWTCFYVIYATTWKRFMVVSYSCLFIPLQFRTQVLSLKNRTQAYSRCLLILKTVHSQRCSCCIVLRFFGWKKMLHLLLRESRVELSLPFSHPFYKYANFQVRVESAEQIIYLYIAWWHALSNTSRTGSEQASIQTVDWFASQTGPRPTLTLRQVYKSHRISSLLLLRVRVVGDFQSSKITFQNPKSCLAKASYIKSRGMSSGLQITVGHRTMSD
jgi:hypothetical protein